MRKLSSRLSLFSRKEGQPSASRDSGPTVAEARRRMKSWGSQLDVADKLERDRPLFARRPRTRVSCWIVMMRSFLTSSDAAASAPLQMNEFLEVMEEMITGLSLYGETSSLKAPSWPSKPLNLA